MSDFYNLESILKRCEKIYESGELFASYIKDENLFPFSINLKKLKQSDIQKDYQNVLKSIKNLQKQAFFLEYQSINFKSLGSQNIPIKISIETLDNFFKLVDKKDEYQLFVVLYGKIYNRYPKLKELFEQKPFLILEYKDIWDELLSIAAFLLENPTPNIYIRELNIKSTDTKFFEKYKKIIDLLYASIREIQPLSSLSNFGFERRYGFKYPTPIIRFRILDENLYIQGLSDLSVTLDEFKNIEIGCKNIYIVENKITTLSFPSAKDSIVIFGQGYGVSVLKDIEWLKDKNIFYWGDIDLDGFAILSQLKGYYPNAESMFMDTQTLERFIELKVEAQTKNTEKYLPNLNQDERVLYERLVNEYYGKNFRLEQERIPFKHILKSVCCLNQ